MARINSILPLALAVILAQSQICAGDKVFAVPRCQTAPVIDGDLGDKSWNDALAFPDFRWSFEGAPSATTENTELKMMSDGDNLYLGLKCLAENAKKLTALAPANGCHDLRDDRVEIYLDQLNCADGPRQCLIINSMGTLRGLLFGGSVSVKDGWRPGIDVKTKRYDTCWTVEARLPSEALGKASWTGEISGINIERMHSNRGTTTLVPAAPGASVATSLAKLSFGSEGVVATTRGALAPDGFKSGANLLEFDVENPSGRPMELVLSAENLAAGKIIGRESATVAIEGKRGTASLLYQVLGCEGEQVRFSVKDKASGRELYRNSYDVGMINPCYRLYRLQDPLFEPLLDKTAARTPALEGFGMWQQPLRVYPVALKYANAYSFDGVQVAARDAGFHFLTYGNWAEIKTVPSVWKECWQPPGELARMASDAKDKGWAKPVLYSPYYIVGVDAAGKPGLHDAKTGSGFLSDPVNATAYLDATAAVVEKHHDQMWAVSAGDEQLMQNYLRLLAALREEAAANGGQLKSGSPLSTLNEEVRRDYGFGKYAIPFDLDKKDPAYPFAHGAFMRWLQDKLRPVNLAMSRRVKAIDPRMPVVSEDCMGNLMEDISSFGDYADIGQLQLADPFYTRRQHWAFSCKVVRDISGLSHVLACAHEAIDGYNDGACGPEEIIELYSQIFRGGGTGVFAWPASWGGPCAPTPDAGSAVIGYPTAWEMLLAVMRQAKSMPPLRFPVPDSAIHLSETASFHCRDTVRFPFNPLTRHEDVFTHIGVVARGWFKFTSDSKVKSGKDRLGDYKAVYLPDVKYSEPALVDKLRQYCEGGGTLVCLDPDAFAFDVSGASMTAAREALFGVRVVGKTTAKSLEVKLDGLERQLPVMDVDLNELEAVDCAVAARFDNGKPAMTVKQIGKGRTLFFAYVPVNAATVENDQWRSFWTDFHKALGCATGHDIWRFRFPMPEIAKSETPTGRCLTGNFGYWDRFRFQDGGARFNLSLEGVYSVKRGTQTSSPFTLGDGKLTDRLKGVAFAKTLAACGVAERLWTPESAERWVETFKGDAPVEVSFRFAAACVPRSVKLWYGGGLASVDAHTSADGKTWDKAGTATAGATGDSEVRELSLVLAKPAAPVRDVKFVLTATAALTLAEIEIWGDIPKPPSEPTEFSEGFETAPFKDTAGRLCSPLWNFNISSYPADSGSVSLCADALGGQYALRVEAKPDGKGAGVCGGRRLPAAAGDTFTVTFQAKGKGALKAGLSSYDRERRFLSAARSAELMVDSSKWQPFEVQLVIPKGEAVSVLTLFDLGKGGDVLIDSLQVKRKQGVATK